MPHTRGSTSTAGSGGREHDSHASQSSLGDHGNSRRSLAKRIRRQKPKAAKSDHPKASASASTSSPPGFVAATSMSIRQSPPPTKPVATSIDTKGKGRAFEGDTPLETLETKLVEQIPISSSSYSGGLQTSALAAEDLERDQSMNTGNLAKEDASPEDSAASSTDELPYVSSPTPSSHATPQAKGGSRAASATPKSSPFKAPITGFEFLAARNNVVVRAPISSSISSKPTATGLGIAGQGLEEMPIEQDKAAESRSKAQVNDLNVSGSTKKKVASSPLTWSTDHKALDAATLGSPTLGSMREPDDQEELARNAITKAAFSVSQATILQELAKRKAQKKSDQEASALTQAAPQPSTNGEPPEALSASNLGDAAVPEDGVKRRDMVSSRWKPLSPPSTTDVAGNGHARVEAAASSVPDRSPILGGGATSATADAEEEIDDGASDASNTSFFIHDVVRDDDRACGWEALDPNFHSAEKKRHRLENTIYELNKRYRPSPAIIAARREMLLSIRKRLNWTLKDWAPDFQYKLETFGSTKYGLDTDSSDLDLCIVDPHRPDGFRNACDLYDLSEPHNGHRDIIASTEEDEETIPSTPLSRHKRNKKWAQSETRKRMTLGDVYDVHRLADTLRKMGHQDIIAIPNAVVPIVKFKSREGLKADMVSLWYMYLHERLC